jgi:hypothetical protein
MFKKPSDEELRSKLSRLQYDVTQHEGTEPPFRNEFWDNHKEGLYVDVVSGEPLFSSREKFESGTGWPSFWQPLDAANERIEELSRHPEWWFGDGSFASWERLLEALEAVVASHRATTFVAAHVASSAEDLRRVDQLLAANPNLHVDISARIGELGRQPRAARALIERHPDRVLFGTDAFPPERADYELHFRFLETLDESFAYGPDPDDPWPQGRWTISALGLDGEALEAVYAGNARRLLRLAGE